MADNKIGSNRGRAGRGRPKGSPNKISALLKDAILEAAEKAGNKDGLVGYLQTQAQANPQAFLTLLGKVLPLQVTGEGGGPITVVERILVDPKGEGAG